MWMHVSHTELMLKPSPSIPDGDLLSSVNMQTNAHTPLHENIYFIPLLISLQYGKVSHFGKDFLDCKMQVKPSRWKQSTLLALVSFTKCWVHQYDTFPKMSNYECKVNDELWEMWRWIIWLVNVSILVTLDDHYDHTISLNTCDCYFHPMTMLCEWVSGALCPLYKTKTNKKKMQDVKDDGTGWDIFVPW